MVVIIAFAALIVLRLFMLQILKSNVYAEKAQRQYLAPSSDSFDRGNIYFTNKDGTTIAAATVQSGFKLAINPGLIKDPAETFSAIEHVVPIDENSFLASASKKNDPYEEVAQRLTETQANKISDEELAGVSLYRQKWRFYPGGTLGANMLGFVSYKENDLVGRYGLERSYNDVLMRSEGDFYVNFFAEIFTNLQSALFQNKAATGDVVTHIEPTVQTQLDTEVADVAARWHSDHVGAVVMDPSTGEVIAMSNAPSFDLNNYGSVDDVSLYNNPIVEGIYEMGSIIKPLVMAGAIEVGAITPQTTYTDNKGSVTVGNATMYNFDKKGRGTVTMQDVLNQSLNTGMVFVQQKMGKTAMKEYLVNHFKLGEKTGIDLPAEVNGRLQNLNSANDVNYAAASFGQGIATTPINVVRAYAAIANGGYLVTPHVATAIEDENGITKKLSYQKSGPILKPETVQTITNMLTTVVDIGYKRGNAHYSVAAKTGTAQIAKPDGTGYYDDKHLHSLIGFFPATNPKFVVYFFNVNPKGVAYASQSLMDPFFDTIQFLANYYAINPDR